jgi:hypothetical protein
MGIFQIHNFFFSLLYYHCTVGTWWHLQKFLQYIIVKFTPSIIFLCLPSPCFWNSFHRPHFSISYISTHYFHHVHPLTPFPYILSPPTGTNPRQGLFYLPVLYFWKKDIFVCLWYLYWLFHCDTSMYMCIVSQIGLSIFFKYIISIF